MKFQTSMLIFGAAFSFPRLNWFKTVPFPMDWNIGRYRKREVIRIPHLNLIRQCPPIRVPRP